MRYWMIGAAVAAALASAPAAAQQSAMKDGPMWTAARIAVEEGQMENYMDYLAKTWTVSQDYAKSQGWLLDYYILQSVNPRDGEPNIILISRFADMPSAAESERRTNILNQRLSQDDHSAAAASGQRNTMRKIQGSILYREQVKR
ncbi:MAG: hypothetical protein V4444_09150 [Pseudomonadota bacterium]